jgi:hypothetical protein
LKALERPALLALDKPAPPFSGKRWKFWNDAPPLAPLDGELCEVGDAPLEPPLELPLGATLEDEGASLDPDALDEAPLVWDGVEALD